MFNLQSIFHSSLTIGLSMALAVPASAQEAPKAEKKKERLVCETIMTGTRIRSQRVCMTRDQWRVAKDRNSDDLRAGREQQHVVRYGLSGRSTCSASSSTTC